MLKNDYDFQCYKFIQTLVINNCKTKSKIYGTAKILRKYLIVKIVTKCIV